MKISIFVKTFFMLLLSFSIVLLLNIYISYQRFSPLYIEKNIERVKSSILLSTDDLLNDVPLSETKLEELSSETSFILYKDNQIVEELGPDFLNESDLLPFVIDIFDHEDTIVEDKLSYTVVLNDDIYEINYIYTFDINHYLIISTRIQSLQNIDLVLNEINMTQSIFMIVAVTLLSVMISLNTARPIKKINQYAKRISSLDFSTSLNLKRHDEFRELNTSLNEMTYNLKKSYHDLDQANQKLSEDFDQEKIQEEKKKDLIMTINHELKTPLAIMKGMIEGMIDGVGRYKDKDTYLKELMKQVDAIEQITNDLTYSLKLEDKVDYTKVSHTDDMLKHLESMSLFSAQHFVSINKDISPATLKMDKELLLIVISNLVKNAVIYSDDSHITIQGQKNNNQYVITVKNKGYIPDEEIEKLFESFYRSNRHKEHVKGSGLGLHIVKQICSLYQYPYKIFNDNGYVTAKIIITIKE